MMLAVRNRTAAIYYLCQKGETRLEGGESLRFVQGAA
jgi:hypothetical protein